MAIPMGGMNKNARIQLQHSKVEVVVSLTLELEDVVEQISRDISPITLLIILL